MVKNGFIDLIVDFSNVEVIFLVLVNVVFSVCGIFGNVLVFIVVVWNW